MKRNKREGRGEYATREKKEEMQRGESRSWRRKGDAGEKEAARVGDDDARGER